jgi:ubiquinone/menaquinone biosynthesis C-methylase UbiE
MKRAPGAVGAIAALLACVLASCCLYHEPSSVWFSKDLPPPEEVAAWSETERFNRLFRLSRWEGFLSGVQFNRFVRDQILPLGQNNTQRFRFLEVGVGVGAFALEVLKMFPHAHGVGIDVVPEAIAIAKAVLPKDRMAVRVGDMRDLHDIPDSSFDVVYVPGAICYLQSLAEVAQAVAEFRRVLRAGGGLCLSMIASATSETGSCITRIPEPFWTQFAPLVVLRVDRMDSWHLPHAFGRYSVCLRKEP